MFYRIVMHILSRGTEVLGAPDDGLCGVTPNLPPPRVFFAVPVIRTTPMQLAHAFQQGQHVFGRDKRMVMIGQHHPCGNAGRVLVENAQQGLSERLETFDAMADV